MLPLIKKIWQGIMEFGCIFSIANVRLDLPFLIQMEKDGNKVLKFYKRLSNNYCENSNQNQSQQEFSVSDLKLLLNNIYSLYD